MGGYTLLELALVLGLMGLMLAQAMPALIERAAERAVRATVEDARALAAAAVRYRMDPSELTEPNRGHYGEWPTAWGDLVPDYLAHFRGSAADGFRNSVGRGMSLNLPAPPPPPAAPPEDPPLRIDVDFGDPAHALRFAFLAGPMACSADDADCQNAGCDGSALTPPESRACLFVPPPPGEFVLDHFALLDGSRPFILDGTDTLEVQDASAGPPTQPTTVVSMDANGTLRVRGRVVVGNGLIADGRIHAGAVIAREIDAADVALCRPGCPIPGLGLPCPGTRPAGGC